jgi:hypothetical protein
VVQTVMLIIGSLLTRMLGTTAVWLVITCGQSPAAVAPLIYRVPAVCDGPGAPLTIDAPRMTTDPSVERNAS